VNRAGRLLCVGLRGAEPGADLLEADLEACRRAGVGGVILFDVDVPTLRRLERQGVDPEDARRRAVRNILDPDQLGRLVVRIREVLGEDVFVAIDQEGGQVARLTSRRGFRDDPSASEFAALEEERRRQSATNQAEQLARFGIDLNFAPCVDLDFGEANPIIGRLGRAYAADPAEVAACARISIAAHRMAGVASCLKHFPGHGSSRADSHLGAVDITGTWDRDRELAPYRDLATEEGVAVMVAHVAHRGLDAELPASLSPVVIGDLLRADIGFNGVVVTDSIDMRAVADLHDPGEAAVQAVRAGADFVIDGFNLDDRTEHPAPALAAALAEGLGDGRIAGGAHRLEESLERLALLRRQIGTDR